MLGQWDGKQSISRCLDHSAGKSVRRATPMPYGTELAEALRALRFQGQSRCLVSLDKDVRDYLLRAIRAR
jgi:hypothetical protein